MRLSRWGQSPYETDDDMVRERRALAAHVDVCAPGVDAEIVVVHSKVPMGKDEHLRAPSVRLVLTTTSGTDHIDLDHFGARVCLWLACRRPAGMRLWTPPSAR